MSVKTLHYIYDPLCGWCYGIAPFIQAAHKRGVTIALHGGRMIAGSQRRPADDSMREMIRNHNQRITQLTGRPFTDAFYTLLKIRSGDGFRAADCRYSQCRRSPVKALTCWKPARKPIIRTGCRLTAILCADWRINWVSSDIQSDNTEQHIHESRQLFVHNRPAALSTPLLEEGRRISAHPEPGCTRCGITHWKG